MPACTGAQTAQTSVRGRSQLVQRRAKAWLKCDLFLQCQDPPGASGLALPTLAAPALLGLDTPENPCPVTCPHQHFPHSLPVAG